MTARIKFSGGLDFDKGRSKPLRVRKSRKPLYNEHTEQTMLFDWIRAHEQQYPDFKLIYAIPNGGHRNKAVAAAMHAEGCRAGVLDIHVPIPSDGYSGLWIEMKAGDNTLSPNQKEWKLRMEEFGHRVVTCYRAEDAADIILRYLHIEPGTYTPLIVRR